MKKILICTLMASILVLSACTNQNPNQESTNQESTNQETNLTDLTSMEKLTKGNEDYVNSTTNDSQINSDIRADLATNGQEPFATIVACSDSRVPPEHIFSAGLGELFVIRTAGNTISQTELGSVEYGAYHLHTDLVVVMGHTSCGAVDAAINDTGHDHIEYITEEIQEGIGDITDTREAEIQNVNNSIEEIKKSTLIQEMINKGEVKVVGALYDTHTGVVEYL